MQMTMKPILLGIITCTIAAWCQKPVISRGGVVNAASYSTGIDADSSGTVFASLDGGSIATIFGTNLAITTQTAEGTPLPRQLGGTSVSVFGIAAPLFYVSPTQINFQMPSSNDTTPGASPASAIVVSTAAGASEPYVGVIPDLNAAVGIFSMDTSGCGPGAVLNVATNGSTSINSPLNSAVPGDYISIYGTGNGVVYNQPPDGTPAPLSPLAPASVPGAPLFDFDGAYNGGSWEGRAPGFVGLDQFNFQVPVTVRQGCAVPLQILNYNISRPVTLSIAGAGGLCSDPPTQGYGEITWEKTVTTTVASTYSVTETDSLTVSLQASPGKQAPTMPVYSEGALLPPSYTYYGPACPIPGYRSLGAGTVTGQGPGLATTAAPVAPLQGGTVLSIAGSDFDPIPAFQSGQVTGLTVYQATFPNGTIQQGSFTVSAAGGSDVGSFQTTVQIGSPIQIQTALATRVLYAGQPYTITWTGGDPSAWVTVKLLQHENAFDYYPYAWVARASDESITIAGQLPGGSYGSGGPLEMVIEVVPDPSQVQAFSAAGLSLGGVHLWKYSYRFEGLSAQD